MSQEPDNELDQALDDLVDDLDAEPTDDELDQALDELVNNLDDDSADDAAEASDTPAERRRVFWWAKGDGSDLQVAWYRLEYFVEWLFAVYAPSAQEIPDCWVAHHDVVQELWALMLAHEAWHASDEDPTGPLQFAGQWAQTRARLQLRPGSATCSAGEHRPVLRVDDPIARRASYPVPGRSYAWSWPTPEEPTRD